VFLGRLLRSTTGKVFVIADHLRAHGTPAVADWVADHRDRIELFYRSPGTRPELNATEYLNNDLKGRVNEAGLPNTKGELRSRMPTVHEQTEVATRTRSELLQAPMCALRHGRIACEPLTCRGNNSSTAFGRCMKNAGDMWSKTAT